MSSIFEESLSYRPFKYPWAVDAAQKHSIDMFWDIHQVELQDDLRQYNAKDGLATPNVSHEVNKSILDNTLCLFTEMDKTVGEGYTKVLHKIRNNEIRNMMMTFAAREVTHQRAYALSAETFGFTDKDWSRFSEYVEMRDKLDAMSRSFYTEGIRLQMEVAIDIAQIAIGEGLGLFGAFASLLNFKRFGKLIGFNDINQWSLVDEQEHVVNNFRTIREIRKELTEVENIELDRIILKIMDEFVLAEHTYIDLAYRLGNQEGLTKEELKEYILYLRELRLYEMGMISVREVRKNPLSWMEWLVSGAKHDNFFEKKVTDYQHGLTGEISYEKYQQRLLQG
jgi:ribonucleotide reductase beta subunit family protein with ferritin-like domain